MAYIDEKWTNEQQALIMADEGMRVIVEKYNDLVELSKTKPEYLEVVKTLKFAASHAQSVKDVFIRPAVPSEIWAVVDEKERVSIEQAKQLFNGEVLKDKKR